MKQVHEIQFCSSANPATWSRVYGSIHKSMNLAVLFEVIIFFSELRLRGVTKCDVCGKMVFLNFDLESKTNVECLTNFASPFRVPHSQCVFKIYPGTRITEIQKRKHSMRCNNNSSLSVFICLVTLCITETIMDIIFRKRVMADKWGSWPVMRRIESARSILWPNDVDRLTFADVK